MCSGKPIVSLNVYIPEPCIVHSGFCSYAVKYMQYNCPVTVAILSTYPFIYTFVDITENDTAEEGSIRLVGGDSPLEGRVEIFLLGQWGTVCDNRYSYGRLIYWDLADATVVCHQLGYLRAVGSPRAAAFGVGSGPSWYSNVRCVGKEMNLTECSKSFSSLGSACPHSQDVGVVCSSKLLAILVCFCLL